MEHPLNQILDLSLSSVEPVLNVLGLSIVQ